MTLRTSNLIRFTPGPHAAEAQDPVARFTLNLATRLDGVTQWSATTGEGLRALLEIAFAPDALDGLCDRAHLVGVTPAGHAPLVLQMAGYWGSTCGYSNPATDVFYVYSDASGDGETLVIDTPCENLYGCFQWPSAIVTYDPPLEDGETAPTVTLQLDSFVGLDGETETGVRLSMRLILKKIGVTGETELKTLNYQAAPHFTGSGTSISVKKSDDDPDPDGAGMFTLTGREIADAVNDVTGDYEIWWRIYHGSGDMLYTAACTAYDNPDTPDHDESQTATLQETVRDRRNAGIGGGFGLFDTTDLKVARVRVTHEPLPFVLKTAYDTGINIDDSLTSRTPLPECGDALWAGDVNGVVYAVSWTGNNILLSGRVLATTGSSTIQCAAIEATDAGLALLYLTGTGPYTLRRLPLMTGRSAVVLASIPKPVDSGGLLFRFSPQVTRLGCFVQPYFATGTAFRNGALYQAEIPAFNGWQTVVALDNDPVDVAYIPLPDSADYSISTDAHGRFVLSCAWDGEEATAVAGDLVSHMDATTTSGISALVRHRLFFDDVELYGLEHSWDVETGASDALRYCMYKKASLPFGGDAAIDAGHYVSQDTPQPEPPVIVTLGGSEIVRTTRAGALALSDNPWDLEAFTQWSESDLLETRIRDSLIRNAAKLLVTRASGMYTRLASDGKSLTQVAIAGAGVFTVINGAVHTNFAYAGHTASIVTPHACLVAPDPSSVKPATGGCVGGSATPAEPPTLAELIAAHNRLRAALGLNGLAENADLNAAAAGHAAWMAANNILSHTGENGSTPTERAIAAGYEGENNTYIDENAARGGETVALVVDGWIGSPGHYANMIDPLVTEIGGGFLPAEGGGYWWCMLFGDRS